MATMMLRYFAIGSVCLWLLFGSPVNDVAGLFWADSPTPLEKVDAFYYPNWHYLSVHRAVHDVGSLDSCRARVKAMAEAEGNPDRRPDDYKGGVGKLREKGNLCVYRITVR
jgi:hypothetical protein